MGERSPGFNNTARLGGGAAAAFAALVDKLAGLPGDAPELPAMVAEVYGDLAAETPFVPLVQAAKLPPYDTTY